MLAAGGRWNLHTQLGMMQLHDCACKEEGFTEVPKKGKAKAKARHARHAVTTKVGGVVPWIVWVRNDSSVAGVRAVKVVLLIIRSKAVRPSRCC